MSEANPRNLDADGAETIACPELPDRLLAKLRIEIPGYQLLEMIASGGQATVYRARELTSGLTVAVKVLNGGHYADADSRERLRREAAALRALNHPNIVCVIEFGHTPMGLDFLVMNYVDGRPLDALWRDRKFSAALAPEPPARLRLFKRICDVVQVAHLKGITHRDLSPSNIVLTADGEPHVLDFGLASTAFNDLLPPGRQVSVTGQFLGKVQYAAPEQARGGRDGVDIRTDVYALGVILYQILTNGAFPYEVVGNLVDVLNHIIHTQPKRPSQALAAKQIAASEGKKLRVHRSPPLVNETIEAVVLKSLEKEPGKRYQSAGELAADIDQYLAGRATTAETRRAPVATRRLSTRKNTIVAITLVLLTGAVMNLRVILNFMGLSTLAAMLGAAPATKPGGGELTSRQQNLLLQLSDAEANIQAINKALVLTGYKVGLAYDRIDSNLKATELMDRKGGGPVRWDEFYGKTARDYGRLNTGSNGYWGDRRPEQFNFIYKANADQVARAKDQISSLAKNQQGLLDRRQKHEADQSRLWATIAFERIKDREIADEAICRFKLKPSTSPDARPEIVRAVVLFLRTADNVASDAADAIENDQDGVFAELNPRMKVAYATLRTALADATLTADLKGGEKATVESLKALCKQLSEECSVVADNHRNAIDRDRAKEDNSKLVFRGALQESLAKFAADVAELDGQTSDTATAWGIGVQRGVATADALPKASRRPAAEHPSKPDERNNDATLAAGDLIQAGSVWTDARRRVTILERRGERVKGKFEEGRGIERNFAGTVKDGKLLWTAGDVEAVKGGRGGDNTGVIKGNKLEFQWHDDRGGAGAYSLQLERSGG